MDSSLKIVIINKSDSTGGAAIVSRRLMEALRMEGADARMLVAEKLTDSPFVELAASPLQIKSAFLEERLKIFLANGLNRKTLFKIDTGSDGLPLWRHPLLKNADAILLNWVNQGMLSLKGIGKIQALGIPVIWTMHDMWCMTGVCHHAGECTRFHHNCGNCPLLRGKASPEDLSNLIWNKKNNLYSRAEESGNPLAFVAVSSWLAKKASESRLLSGRNLNVIPNAFNIPISSTPIISASSDKKIRILFGAARLDDPIKGLDTLRSMSEVLPRLYPEPARRLEIALFGSIKDPSALEGFGVPIVNLGVLKGEEAIRKAYENAQILVSASSYETLPGTLVEAQAYGVIPVAFDRGGQRDIVDHKTTGYLAEYEDDITIRAKNLADGVLWAVSILDNETHLKQIRSLMRQNVADKFSYSHIAREYIDLILQMKKFD